MALAHGEAESLERGWGRRNTSAAFVSSRPCPPSAMRPAKITPVARARARPAPTPERRLERPAPGQREGGHRHAGEPLPSRRPRSSGPGFFPRLQPAEKQARPVLVRAPCLRRTMSPSPGAKTFHRSRWGTTSIRSAVTPSGLHELTPRETRLTVDDALGGLDHAALDHGGSAGSGRDGDGGTRSARRDRSPRRAMSGGGTDVPERVHAEQIEGGLPVEASDNRRKAGASPPAHRSPRPMGRRWILQFRHAFRGSACDRASRMSTVRAPIRQTAQQGSRSYVSPPDVLLGIDAAVRRADPHLDATSSTVGTDATEAGSTTLTNRPERPAHRAIHVALEKPGSCASRRRARHAPARADRRERQASR